ncbi:DUF2510 domain-containing protein [Microbacterium tumbae]
MSAPQGWYDAGVPGRQRWWDGAQWTAHERDAFPAAPPMGWYPVPGASDVRWWDGAVWTPYRIRDGRPKPDFLAIEPPNVGVVLGILFLGIGVLQLFSAMLSRSAGLFVAPVLFFLAGALWIAGSIHSSGLRKLPRPASAPVMDPSARPLPGEVEGPDAGWYPMTRQVTRWWTGARWSWYIRMRFGPRPGHAGPRGYLVSMIMGWFLAAVAAIGLVSGILGVVMAPDPVAGFLSVIGFVFAVLFGALAAFVLLLTRSRRNAMLLPKTPPPLR